jgi:hypothetical protein
MIKELVSIAFVLALGGGAVHAQSNSEERTVAPFSRLKVDNGIDVYLTQAPAQSLRIEVDGYELGQIVTEVVGEELRLSNKGRSGWRFLDDRDVKVYLDFVELSAIEASSGSDIEGRNAFKLDELTVSASGGSDVELDVRAERLEFHLSGGSDLDVRGETRSLVVEASGGSDVSARSLNAAQARVDLSGGSDASIRATAAVVVRASGGSDVAVHGNPAERAVDNDRSSDVVWR